MKFWRKILLSIFLIWNCFVVTVPIVQASEGEVLGVHILSPGEIEQADKLVETKSEDWHYVTIPFTLDDIEKTDQWQDFFNKAENLKIIPIVRLATRVENAAWQVPSRKELVEMIDCLSTLDWPTEKKHIIVFNEVNHAKEWGDRIDPQEYVRVLRFVSNWTHTEMKNYVVLPAAMDLAAPNGSQTMEAFNYLEQMYAYDPEIFSYVDLWNSHSYPNPGFGSSPERTAKNSLRGFIHELDFLKEKTGREYQVIISETGWVANGRINQWLDDYYTYALQHIWSDPRVVAVTPFLLKGDPGPFAGFGFLDRNDEPTVQYLALRKALEEVEE